MLEFICTATMVPGQSAPKEYDIAVGAKIRPASFDPKLDPIVRVSFSGIRERLLSFYGAEGQSEALRLTIPKGEYRAVFEHNETEAGNKQGAFAAFWGDYLNPQTPNLLLFVETLFFRDDKGSYVRNIYVNDPKQGTDAVAKALPEIDVSRFRPSYNFVPAGEVHTLLAIKASFDAANVFIEPRNARFVTWSDIKDSNLVLIGSTRTHPFIASLSDAAPFVLEERQIRNTQPAPGEPATYQGREFVDGNLERTSEYALITRRPAPVGEGTITMITANHGRAIEGGADYLTRVDRLASLVARLAGPEGQLPSHFQVLLSVEMIDFDQEVVGVEYLTHRIFESSSQL